MVIAMPNLAPQSDMHTTMAIAAYPWMCGQDEFQPLLALPCVCVVWVRSAQDLSKADVVILPDSANPAKDLQWMRAQGLDAAISAHADAGGCVVGIGGGLPILGEALIDLHHVDGNAAGLGLLPLVTLVAPQTTQRHVQVSFPPLRGPWASASGCAVDVTEKRGHQTALRADMCAQMQGVELACVPGSLWQNAQGNVWGCYWLGLFANAAWLQAMWGVQAGSTHSKQI